MKVVMHFMLQWFEGRETAAVVLDHPWSTTVVGRISKTCEHALTKGQ